jgi:hypothetical protein
MVSEAPVPPCCARRRGQLLLHPAQLPSTLSRSAILHLAQRGYPAATTSSRTLAASTPKITTFANALYTNRPFILEYDPRVAMALIDARYNPAGVPLYTGENPDIPKMWNALDPRHRDFDPKQGIALFEVIWGTKRSVPARYIRRHFQRVEWMRHGLSAMGYL